MKPRAYIANSIRFIFLILLQSLVFKSINLEWGSFNYIHFVIFPLFIILAPLNMPRFLLILTSFLMGLSIDMFYDSVGVHASASVFTAFIRPVALKIMEPYGGYSVDISPSRFNLGFAWFLSYASILLFLHFLFYFSVEAFSFVYYLDIILRTIFSFLFSMVIIVMHQLIFKTRV